MQTKIQKWGNSLGLRIPKVLADQTGVGVGSEVDLTVEDGELVIRPARKPHYVLKRLLSDVTAHNLHREIDMGMPAGGEVW